MATTKRDYYEVLGVSSKASVKEIKSAFRRLARRLHPDVSREAGAEARFREAAEAYEVLSKPETRQLYDRYGHEGLQTGGFRPRHFEFGDLGDLFSVFFGEDVFGPRRRAGRRSARGEDVLAEVEIGLAEAATGTTRRAPFPVAVACPACGGSGAAPGAKVVTCPRCNGTGQAQTVSSSFFGRFVHSQTCPECAGGGEVVSDPCRDCGGSGRGVEERTLEVEIPPGIHDGQRIRLVGEGHAGVLGGRAGDVYVLVRVRPDPRFIREGSDVVTNVNVTMTEAALGARVSVPTLTGDVEVELEPGTQPGDVLLLRARGMPVLEGRGRGDQRVVVNVTIPRNLSAEQRRLLEEFERRANDGNYEDDDGFLDKLRAAFR